MNTPALFELQATKAVEYLIALGFLMLFVPFWRYLAIGRARPAAAPATKTVDESAPPPEPLGIPGYAAPVPVGWFDVPEGLAVHPGHAWARSAEGDEVIAGVDDFARAVIGPVHDVDLPAVGSIMRQGEPGWVLRGAAGPVTILSPVDGMVVATNPAARVGALETDPYGEGWLVRVHAPRFRSNLKQLLSGSTARAWMEEVASRLRAAIAPELGPAAADGGVPVHGIAFEVGPECWSRIAREFFLLEESDPAGPETELEPRRSGRRR